MRNLIFMLFCTVLIANLSMAQVKPVVSTTVIHPMQLIDQQWEYLVISFGKTGFGTPEKMMAYKMVGIENGNESISLQSNLDILGRFGWELVNTVGSIGGDQEIIMKRKYDKIRSANEYGLIQNGKQLYLNDLQDIVERSLRLAEEQKKFEEQIKNRQQLKNLDDIERDQKKEQLRISLENIYKNKFDQTEIAKNSTFTLEYKSSYSSDIQIVIKTNLTNKYLIDGNSYHGDIITEDFSTFLKTYRFRDPLLDKYTGISIRIYGFIIFNGETINVSNIEITQSFLDSDWTNY